MGIHVQLSLAVEEPRRETRNRDLTLRGKRYKVSPVFDTYWKFAAERQMIFFNRLRGHHPWTGDPILRTYKFTNAYRASDRVSQYLIKKVIYNSTWSNENIFFRTLLFKFFNKIETWELLENSFGPISVGAYNFDRFDQVLSQAIEAGKAIYSAAYIMPSGGKYGERRKHRMHLRLLECMLRDNLPQQIASSSSMSEAFTALRGYQSIGDFLAYQYVTDLNYSELCNFTESEFVVAGPGAKDGIRKCFPDLDMKQSSDVIRLMADIQEEQFSRLGLQFNTLWGRKLQLIDCQNLFCEVDKYSRIAHPEIAGLSGRSRIKQQYRTISSTIAPFYPPKWRLDLSASHR